MAIASMKKLLLVGNKSERKLLMKDLQKLGCVEVSKPEQIARAEFALEENLIDVLKEKLGKISFLFEFLKDMQTEGKQLVKNKKISYKPFKCDSPFASKPSLSFDEFADASQKENEVMIVVEKLQELCEKQLDIKSQILKQENLKESVSMYLRLPRAFNFYNTTKNASVTLGLLPFMKIEKLNQLNEVGAEYEVFENGATAIVAIVALKENQEQIHGILSSLEFVNCSLGYDKKATDITKECEDKIAELKQLYNDTVSNILTYESVIPNARLLFDYYTVEVKKIECEGDTASTNSSYYLEGWLPAKKEIKVSSALENSTLALNFIIRDPLDDEIPPTLVVSNKVVAPYESITNMFSSPNYREFDPNPFLAFFFFVFFGMMLSDAGYGLVLTIGAGIVMKIRHDPKGQGNLIKIMFMGGISTIIWGIIFGSYFGLSAGDLNIPYWFNPIEKPMNMLYLSLGMGVFQMCFGIGINMVALFKAKKPFSAICGAFSWYFMIIGIAVAMLLSKYAPWVSTVGWGVAGVGLVLLMIAGTIGKKGFKKASGAFSNVYGIINFFSDLMSYTRIFGLGLATAVIGMVFNQIGMLIADLVPIKVIGWIGAIIIFLIGHIFNIGINALGAYVHNSRLQFVEFFNKFYAGGGELMQPLGSEMKYYYIKPEEVD